MNLWSLTHLWEDPHVERSPAHRAPSSCCLAVTLFNRHFCSSWHVIKLWRSWPWRPLLNTADFVLIAVLVKVIFNLRSVQSDDFSVLLRFMADEPIPWIMVCQSSSLLIEIVGWNELACILKQSDVSSYLLLALHFSLWERLKRSHIGGPNLFHFGDKNHLLHPCFKNTWRRDIRSWLGWRYLIGVVSCQVLIASWVVSCVCKLWHVIRFDLRLKIYILAVNFCFFDSVHLGLTLYVRMELRRIHSTININFDFSVVNLLTISKRDFLLLHNWSKVGLILGNVKVAMVLLRDHLRSLVANELWQYTLGLWPSLLWSWANKVAGISFDWSAHILWKSLLRRDTLFGWDVFYWRAGRNPCIWCMFWISFHVSHHPRVRISLLDSQIHALVIYSLLRFILLGFLSILLADFDPLKASRYQVLVIFH